MVLATPAAYAIGCCFILCADPARQRCQRSDHLDSIWPIRHPGTCIQTRAGALTNLLPRQGGLPKGDVAEKWQMKRTPALLVEQTQRSIMAIFPNLSRRQVFTSAATITVAGIAPNLGFEASEIAQQAQVLAPPSKEAQAPSFSAVTLLRLREIAERNRVRQEAGLPLLSVPKELRRMKQAADAEKFRNLLRHIGSASTKRCCRGCAADAATHTGLRLAGSQVADCGLAHRSIGN
jgi:hypothetical protein